MVIFFARREFPSSHLARHTVFSDETTPEGQWEASATSQGLGEAKGNLILPEARGFGEGKGSFMQLGFFVGKKLGFHLRCQIILDEKIDFWFVT